MSKNTITLKIFILISLLSTSAYAWMHNDKLHPSELPKHLKSCSENLNYTGYEPAISCALLGEYYVVENNLPMAQNYFNQACTISQHRAYCTFDAPEVQSKINTRKSEISQLQLEVNELDVKYKTIENYYNKKIKDQHINKEDVDLAQLQTMIQDWKTASEIFNKHLKNITPQWEQDLDEDIKDFKIIQLKKQFLNSNIMIQREDEKRKIDEIEKNIASQLIDLNQLTYDMCLSRFSSLDTRKNYILLLPDDTSPKKICSDRSSIFRILSDRVINKYYTEKGIPPENIYLFKPFMFKFYKKLDDKTIILKDYNPAGDSIFDTYVLVDSSVTKFHPEALYLGYAFVNSDKETEIFEINGIAKRLTEKLKYQYPYYMGMKYHSLRTIEIMLAAEHRGGKKGKWQIISDNL